MAIDLRLATGADVPRLQELIPEAARALSEGYYSDRQIESAIRHIFGNLNLPVALGLPVGHGPNFAPLPLGAHYRLSMHGHLTLTHWNWLQSPPPGAIPE